MHEFSGDRVQLATRIPQRLHRALRLHVIEDDTSIMVFVNEALTEHLARCRARTATRRPRKCVVAALPATRGGQP